MQYCSYRKKLILGVGLILLLLSWWIPYFRTYWDMLDSFVFLKLNHFWVGREIGQKFWAWMNSRYGDWTSEAIILWFYIFKICFGPRKGTRKAVYQMLFSIFFIASVMILVNKMLFLKFFQFDRLSPSLTLGLETDFSKFAYLPNNKVFSVKSFPADHATTLFLAFMFIKSHLGCKKGIFFLAISIFFILPRLISGAHWFTDVVVGAGLISLVTGFFGLILSDFLFKKDSLCIATHHKENLPKNW